MAPHVAPVSDHMGKDNGGIFEESVFEVAFHDSKYHSTTSSQSFVVSIVLISGSEYRSNRTHVERTTKIDKGLILPDYLLIASLYTQKCTSKSYR